MRTQEDFALPNLDGPTDLDEAVLPAIEKAEEKRPIKSFEGNLSREFFQAGKNVKPENLDPVALEAVKQLIDNPEAMKGISSHAMKGIEPTESEEENKKTFTDNVLKGIADFGSSLMSVIRGDEEPDPQDRKRFMDSLYYALYSHLHGEEGYQKLKQRELIAEEGDKNRAEANARHQAAEDNQNKSQWLKQYNNNVDNISRERDNVSKYYSALANTTGEARKEIIKRIDEAETAMRTMTDTNKDIRKQGIAAGVPAELFDNYSIDNASPNRIEEKTAEEIAKEIWNRNPNMTKEEAVAYANSGSDPAGVRQYLDAMISRRETDSAARSAAQEKQIKLQQEYEDAGRKVSDLKELGAYVNTPGLTNKQIVDYITASDLYKDNVKIESNGKINLFGVSIPLGSSISNEQIKSIRNNIAKNYRDQAVIYNRLEEKLQRK